MPLPKYLLKTPSERGTAAERKFIKKHARSGAGVWEKDDFGVVGGARIEYKLVCRGTRTHVLRWDKIVKLMRRAEQRGQIPVYLMKVEGVGEFVLLPRKYLKG